MTRPPLLLGLLLVLTLSAQSMICVTVETEGSSGGASGQDSRSWDLEHSNYPPDLEVDGRSRQFPNVSIFKILRHGCFDHDVTRFCSNRMTRFSCLYWIDTHAGDKTNSFKGGAKVEENLKKLGLGADFFENMDLSEGFGSIDVQRPRDGASATPQRFPQPLPGNESAASVLRAVRPDLQQLGNPAPNAEPAEAAHPIDEERRLLPDCAVYRGRVDLPETWRLVFAFSLPVFMALGALGNLLASVALAGMGRKVLPLCYFSSAVAGLDCLLILISAGDLWLRSVARVDANFMLLFACETCCQVYPMVYTFASHLRQLCLLAIAVDTLQLYQRLDKFYPKYDTERVFNCFVLFIALLLSLNCQFLWTYSLSRLDNPGETNRGYHCGFSDKWVEIRYKAVIWPLIDLAIGDLLPLSVSTCCSLRLMQLFYTGKCRWLQPESIGQVVYVEPESFVQVRRACLMAVALEIPFSLPAALFSVGKFINSASHMMQEHIFVPSSLRSLLGTQSHASFLDRKNRQDLFFTIDSICHMLLLTWLSMRPLLQFLSQSAFRRQLSQILSRLMRCLATNRPRTRQQPRPLRRPTAGQVRLSVVELPQAASLRRVDNTASGLREPFLIGRV